MIPSQTGMQELFANDCTSNHVIPLSNEGIFALLLVRWIFPLYHRNSCIFSIITNKGGNHMCLKKWSRMRIQRSPRLPALDHNRPWDFASSLLCREWLQGPSQTREREKRRSTTWTQPISHSLGITIAINNLSRILPSACRRTGAF